MLVPAAAVAVAPGTAARVCQTYRHQTDRSRIGNAVRYSGFRCCPGADVASIERKLDGFEVQHPIAILLLMLLFAGGAVFGFRALMRGFGDRGLPGPMSVLRKTAAVGAGPMSFYPRCATWAAQCAAISTPTG